MQFRNYQNIADFLEKTRPAFMEEEALNSLILGISLGIENYPQHFPTAYLATVEDEAGVVLATVMTPPHNLLLYGNSNTTKQEQALDLLIDDVFPGRNIPGTMGRVPLVDQFLRKWEERTGMRSVEVVNQRFFMLTEVTPPPTVPGRLRLSEERDFETVRQWIEAFGIEALAKPEYHDAAIATAQRRIGKSIYVWESLDGTIVTMAGASRPIVNTISIGLVYTPPELRGKGYASNCVAALSQEMLNSGWKYCCLFTDLANPVSNSIYQKMGYQAVGDFRECRFESLA